MNLTLHQAVEDVRELLDNVDPETGELPDALNEARALVERKALAVTAYILESKKQVGYLKSYAQELALRANSMEKRADWLKRYLAEHMAALGLKEVTDERGLFSAKLQVGRDKAVEVFDERQLPNDYLREIPAKWEPDKRLISKAIEDGFEVPGARMVARDRLVIR